MKSALEKGQYPNWIPSGRVWNDTGVIDRAWRRHAARTGCSGENVDRLGGWLFGSHHCGDCKGSI